MIGGAEGGEPGEGDVGRNGDGDGGLRRRLRELDVREMGICGGDLAEEAGEVGGLDVLGRRGAGDGLVGCMADGDVLSCAKNENVSEFEGPERL